MASSSVTSFFPQGLMHTARESLDSCLSKTCSYLPLFCRPKAPYGSVEAAITALKEQSLSKIESTLHRYNWTHLLRETSPTRIAFLSVQPSTDKHTRSPSKLSSFIPSLRIELVAKFATFVAICILRTAMIDLNNPPKASWDASRQLGLISNAAAKAVEFSKVILAYFSTPMKGYSAILGAAVILKLAHSLLSYIIEKALPRQNIARDLSEEAKEGTLRPTSLLGRRQTLSEMERALSSDSNVFLIGPTGCGKTALVETLALAIHEGRISRALQNKTVILANAAELVGNTYQWDQDTAISRPPLEALIATMKGKEDRYILFIDEIHAAIGGNARSSTDLIQVLKSRIDGSSFPKLIIATTDKEYNTTLAEDKPFNRRFVSIKIEELPKDELKPLLLQKYSNIIENPTDMNAVLDLFPLTNRVIAFPSCALQLFKLVTSSLTTFSAPAIDLELERKEKELEHKRSHLSEDNTDEITDIQRLTGEIAQLHEGLLKQRAHFEKLWDIHRTINAIFQKCIRLATKGDSYELRLHDAILLPALRELYATEKQKYNREFSTSFVDKASFGHIKSIFDANYPSLIGCARPSTGLTERANCEMIAYAF